MHVSLNGIACVSARQDAYIEAGVYTYILSNIHTYILSKKKNIHIET